jgi:type I restriction enzyme S subunit
MNRAIKYIPLTFVTSTAEKERLILNTLLLRHFARESNREVNLAYYIDGTQYGFNAPARDTGTNKYVRISDISNGEIAWETVPFCDCDEPESYLLKKDDIIVARTGGTTGKSYMVSAPPLGSIFAGYLIRVRANFETNPQFISVFLNSYFYWSQITSLNRDEFRPSVNAEKLKALRVPQFDRSLQDQIVRLSTDLTDGYDSSIRSEVDSVLSKKRLQEAIVAEICDQKLLLENLKQAILREAITGKLTADWRAANPDVEHASELLRSIRAQKAQLIAAKKLRAEKPLPKIKAAEIPFDIPTGWEWCRVADISFVIGGLTKNAARRSAHKRFVPYLRVANVYANRLELADVQEIGVAETELEKLLLEKDDLLVVEGNGSRDQIGRIAKWDGSIAPCIHQNHIIKVRLVDPRIATWALHWFLSPCGRTLIEEQARTSTGLYNLSTGKIASLLIALPPAEEQIAIQDRVEALMQRCRTLADEIQRSQNHAGYLLEGVLAEAFGNRAVETLVA